MDKKEDRIEDWDGILDELYEALLPNIPVGARTLYEIHEEINEKRKAKGLKNISESRLREKIKGLYKFRVGNKVYYLPQKTDSPEGESD